MTKASDNPTAPLLSVIIPTHNRRASLKRMLDALCLQTYPLQQVEVVVVADGCTDDTVKMLCYYKAPFALQIIKQLGKGAATARNQGVKKALGKFLLFLDDDIEPTPSLIEAHIRAHQDQPGRVIIGPYPPAGDSTPDFFYIKLRAWWEEKFNALRRPGYRFTYQDLLSGNFSLEAALFQKLGGFDEAIGDCGGEDYEFGIRLIKAGIPFAFAAEAVAYHHIQETTDLERIFRRARQEGKIDVRIGQRHPELRAQLPIAHLNLSGWRYKAMVRLLIFRGPVSGNLLIPLLQQALSIVEQAKLRAYWHRLYGFLHFYWYWRGVADGVGNWEALLSYVQSSQNNPGGNIPILDLDLSQGLEITEQQLDRERPVAMRLYYGRQPVGLIQPQPGAERLRGIHLRSILSNTLAVPFLEALAIEGVLAGPGELDRYKLFKAIQSKRLWFGPAKIDQMWFEQYSQWNHQEREKTEVGNTPAKDWELLRKAEVETTWLEQDGRNKGWRIHFYRTLYRWHQPFHLWYTSRGWTWLGSLRERVKQLLLGHVKA